MDNAEKSQTENNEDPDNDERVARLVYMTLKISGVIGDDVSFEYWKEHLN